MRSVLTLSWFTGWLSRQDWSAENRDGSVEMGDAFQTMRRRPAPKHDVRRLGLLAFPLARRICRAYCRMRKVEG